MEASKRPVGELKKLCKKWQKLLRLEDWELCPHWAIELEGCSDLANIFTVPERKHACIYFLEKERAEELEGEEVNLETTVIHELLHLHFSVFQNGDDEVRHMLEEQAVHAIAFAFESIMGPNGTPCELPTQPAGKSGSIPDGSTKLRK